MNPNFQAFYYPEFQQRLKYFVIMESGDSVKDMTSKFDKLNKFEGQDFRRWQKKMHFLLTTLKLVYVMSILMPILLEFVEYEPLEATRRRAKWEMMLTYVMVIFSMDEALDKFKIYKQQVELHKNELIKVLHTDRGGGYYDPVYFESTGIIQQTIAPYTPQQNGVAERKNRTLKEMVPNLSYFKVWGCRPVVRFTEPKRKTLGEIGIDCIFIGYVEHSKAYRFYVLESNNFLFVNIVIESKDVIFYEERFTYIPRPRDMIQQSFSKNITRAEDASGGTKDPKTFSEAMASRDVHFWKEAIQDEIDSITHNNTWVLLDLPPNCKALGCKWFLKRKMKVDGTIDKYKARLVIQGFRQKEGFDFFDTYAPVARISTIKLLLALAAIHNLVIHQMDVKTAFLNGDLDKEIYMKQPEGFNCSPVSTPIDPSLKLLPDNGSQVSHLEYSRAIGCLMYAMISIRPNIAYVVGRLSKYTSKPSTHHWQEILRTRRL
uniref:Integrase catalytic domain-containing protein n=1 Tax=Lactuca sativa TaxID=4236 RepID=A0A9R1UEB2_LACSA|nr:hypothetical protein LSAT_V11C900505250 [Lactuca sativa]